VGIVVNNVDSTRSGRLQVWIAEFGASNADGSPNLKDDTTWRTVSYCPPFYGATPQTGTNQGYGTYPGNRNSYGMWFTPPDIGCRVLCFFVAGDPGQGYYVGCIPEDGINHMIPAIGASSSYVPSTNQQNYFAQSKLLPVTEINELNTGIDQNPRFFTAPKPIQSVVAAILFQQGLNNDPVRGPIRSSSQRESPSNAYGISTPGKPIYQGVVNNPDTIIQQLQSGSLKPQDVAVVGRQGGHTLVMDDGALDGSDTLVRIRTAKGHQITMSDSGDCFYITHANGQTWVELGKQGTVDVFSTNSINLRSQGTINLHADQDINMYAGNTIRVKAKNQLKLEGDQLVTVYSDQQISVFSKSYIGIRSDGSLALKSKSGSWAAGSALNLRADTINLNGAAAAGVAGVASMQGYRLPDTFFNATTGWAPRSGALQTIVTRAPTHEPFPYHNKGVNVVTNLDGSAAANQTVLPTARTSRQDQAAATYENVAGVQIQAPISASDYLEETPAITSIPVGSESA
jgi:hypothetical protein